MACLEERSSLTRFLAVPLGGTFPFHWPFLCGRDVDVRRGEVPPLGLEVGFLEDEGLSMFDGLSCKKGMARELYEVL
jgi:hypothetical protein